MPEDGAGRLFLEVKQVHDTAEPAVIALFGFLEHVQVLAQLLVIRPRRTIDTLQHFVRRIAAPIRARNVRELERLAELAGRGQVRAAAEVYELTLFVKRDGLIGWNAGDDLGLVLFAYAAKKLDGLVTVPNLAHDRLVAVDDILHARLDNFKVALREWLLAGEVVVEAVFNRRTDRYLGFGPKLLYGFGQRMGGIVTQ